MNCQEMIQKYGKDFIANVIRIIDNRTILVNAGKDILSVGQTIQVYEVGEPIKDLDEKALGNYIFVKDELEVIQTESNYSICQKQEVITKTVNPLALSPLLLESRKTEYVPLNIEKTDVQQLIPRDRKIRIGDPVRLLDK